MTPDPLNILLTYVLPPILAVVSVVVANIVLRRNGKEANENAADANETNQFEKVTTALFKRIEQLERNTGDLQARITELEGKERQAQRDLATKDEEIRVIKVELSDTKRVNGALARYVKKLIRTWPQGGNLPIPDEPLDLEQWGMIR